MGLIKNIVQKAADSVAVDLGHAIVLSPFLAANAVTKAIKGKRSENRLITQSKANNVILIREVKKSFSKPFYEVLIEGLNCDFKICPQSKNKYIITDLDHNCLGSVDRLKWKRFKHCYTLFAGDELACNVVPRLKEKNIYDLEQLGWVMTTNGFHNKYTITDSEKKKVIEITYTSEDNNNYVVEYQSEENGLLALLLFSTVDSIRKYDI